jgi:hypothetical protein
MHYPEEARKLDEGYAEFGIVVLNSISYIVKDVIVPFFVPSLKKTNNPDKDK